MYLKSNTLVLVDVLKMCLEIYELDPTNLLSGPGLAWEAALKKTRIKKKEKD